MDILKWWIGIAGKPLSIIEILTMITTTSMSVTRAGKLTPPTLQGNSVFSSLLPHALIGAALALLVPTAGAQEARRMLACDIKQPERALLKRAPKEVRRVSKHVLEITLNSGKQRFVDEPPYEESGEMGGPAWRYCGFDKGAKAHLIGMSDDTAYSGKLLMEESGKRLPAGHTVLFSPTGTAFLAIEQQNGRDGEDWAVRDMAGKTIWEGYGGTLAKVDGIDTIVSTFEHPAWTEQGVLTARYACWFEKPGGVVTLARTASGAWRWRGHGKCD